MATYNRYASDDIVISTDRVSTSTWTNNVNNLEIKNIQEILQLPFRLKKEFIITNNSQLGYNVYNENKF